LPPISQACRPAPLEIRVDRPLEPSPDDGGAARECGRFARSRGEHDERLEELRACRHAERGVLRAIEVVPERGRLPRLAGEMIADLRDAVRDRTGDVLPR